MLKKFVFVLLLCLALFANNIIAQNIVEQSSVKSNLPPRIILNDGWLLKSSYLVKEGGEVISTDNFSPQDWYKTTVPTTVLNALIKNGVYPDIRVGLNSFLVPDSSDEFNERHDLAKYSYFPDKRNPWKDPYWYRTEFILPKVRAEKNIWLNFNAINYRAEVWLNGGKVTGPEQMVGAFRRFRFNITKFAKEGQNILAVKIYPVDYPGVPDTQLEVFGPERGYHKEIMKDVTLAMFIGYDCMPTVPDRNMGIWQDVYIDYTGSVDIADPFVIIDLPLPKVDKATLTISAELTNITQIEQEGILKGFISGTDLNIEQDVHLNPGETKIVTFKPPPVIKGPLLWWPVNYGPQNLYNLILTFEINGDISDTEDVTFGVREITKQLYEYKGGHGLRLHINGQKIFCRGGYIQPEILFDWDKQRMETEIRYFTQANLNLVYFEDIPNPPDAFLDACDKYGLLFGNCFYGCYWMQPNSGYPEDVQLLEKCTVDIIKRYRNHPSIWLYMAMNEGDTREDVYNMWRKHIVELDGTRLWIPSGTFPDERRNVPEWFKKDLPVGMTDWGATYTWKPPSQYFHFVRDDRKWMFMMESGSASLPPLDSLVRFIPNLDKPSGNAPYPLDKTWAHHGANHYYKDYDQALRQLYGEPDSVPDYCWKGHLVTADQHRAMFEAVNHRIWDITSGFTQWKINACWPSIQWQIFDWYHKPMVSYYYIKKACEPLHVQLCPLDRAITIVNNYVEPQSSLHLSAEVYNFYMKSIWRNETKTDIAANTYKDVFYIPELANLTPVYFVKLLLKNNDGNALSNNFYWLASDNLEQLKELKKLPLVNLDVSYKIQDKGPEKMFTVKVKNPTDKLAFFVHLIVTKGPLGQEILPVFWEDNYFSLLPNESKELSAVFASESLQGDTSKVEIGGWNIRSNFECTNLQISKKQVGPNEPFDVIADIAKTFVDGSHVELYVDNEVVQSKLMWAKKDAHKEYFTLTQSKKGHHQIKVGSKTASFLVN